MLTPRQRQAQAMTVSSEVSEVESCLRAQYLIMICHNFRDLHYHSNFWPLLVQNYIG